jgi:hypothetical protein
MTRHVRHVHARSNEWIRVHRDRPRQRKGDDGGGWFILLLMFLAFVMGAIF